jgi:ParB family chromosome partitioning protein
MLEIDSKYATVIVKRFIKQVETDEDVYVLRDGEKIHIHDVEKPLEVEEA